MEGSVVPSITCPTLVGRTSHLATLQLLVERVKQGKGHVALISGEAGVGKSRLVAETRTYATTQGFLQLQGNCFPTDMSYPYAPLLDLLRTLRASNPPATLVTAIETLAHDIFPLLPELVPGQTLPLPALGPEQEKRRLFAVLATFFLHLSAQSPVLLIIEDIHWSDSTSMDFLHYLARRSVSQPLLLLVTYRYDEVDSSLKNWLAQLNRERLAQEMRLVPLSHNDVDTMLSAIFDQRHTAFDMRRFLHGELLDALYTLTEGNPFFVEETLSSLTSTGDIFYVQGYWNRRSGREVSIPRSVQDAVQQRTERVSDAAKYVLTLAAVAGRHFDFALLQQLTQYNEHELLSLLKELVAAQLVVEESAEQFAFRHALTRQAIYNQLLTRERTTLHCTIAETLEQQPPATREAHLKDLAYHFYQAKVWEKTVDYAQRAGEKALQLYSHRAAIDYFTWALEAINHLGRPPVARFYRALGQAHEMLGEFEQAQLDYTQALQAARTTQESVAEWQSAIDLGFLWVGRDYTQAETWFRRALDLAQSLDDPVLHAHSLNRFGNWHLNAGQPQEALRYHREALTIFEQLHDSHGIAETLDLLGMASYLSCDLLQGTTYYQQAIAFFRDLGDKAGLTSSLATLTLRGPTSQTDGLITVASLSEVVQDVEHGLSTAREIGHRSAEAYALFQLGLCLGSQGEYGRALITARQSLDVAEEIEHRQWQAASRCNLGAIYSGMLAYPQAREHFEQALALAREIGSLVWIRIITGYLASATISLQNLGEAEKLLQATPDTPAETLSQRLVWCASIELALAQGHGDRALEIIERLNILNAQVAKGQNSLRVLKLQGEALTLLQRPVEAEAAFKAALEIARSQGVPPMQWRICVALGDLYQAQGKNVEAEQVFATARTLIDELATKITDEALRDNFLHRATSLLPSTRPLSSKHAAKQAFDGLTAREREVATLIAQGKFNREIADALVVSERTIETHVSNIMFKLGFTSRRQIAKWAIDKGLTTNS